MTGVMSTRWSFVTLVGKLQLSGTDKIVTHRDICQSANELKKLSVNKYKRPDKQGFRGFLE
jgi:hypothetical protein